MIKNRINTSIKIKERIMGDEHLLQTIQQIAELIIKTCRDGGKILFCGNGGSAADAQHLASELSGRFNFDRPPLKAEACHVNSSFLTAVANDYGYEYVFARYIDAVGKENDVLFGLSTSGNSKNVIKAIEKAKEKGLTIVAFTGKSGGAIKSLADFLVNVPSQETPRIQEAHILIGHIICEIVENEMFKG